jgi:hypothetical protein
MYACILNPLKHISAYVSIHTKYFQKYLKNIIINKLLDNSEERCVSILFKNPISKLFDRKTKKSTGWPDSANFCSTSYFDKTLASFYHNWGSIPHFGATFFHGWGFALILAERFWATFWAIFFTHSSGHTESWPRKDKKRFPNDGSATWYSVQCSATNWWTLSQEQRQIRSVENSVTRNVWKNDQNYKNTHTILSFTE